MSYTNHSLSENGRGRPAPIAEVTSAKPSSPAETAAVITREVERPAINEPVAPAPGDHGQPTPSPKRRSRLLILAALGVGAIAASGLGYRWFQYASTHEETDNATLSGHVYQISSRIPGNVTQVPVTDNQLVKPGQLLVQLDPHDYAVKVQQAQAALQAAQRQAQAAQSTVSYANANAHAQTTQAQGSITEAIASISDAQAAVTGAQAGVPAAQADLAQTQANLEKAQADYTRYRDLYDAGAVPAQQLDSARADYNVALAQRHAAQEGVRQAEAKLTQARQGVSAAQARLASTRGELQQAQAGGVQTTVNRSQYEAAIAAIAQAEANVRAAQLQLSYANITAPEAGRIGRKTVEVGQQIQAGQPLMAVVGNDLWVVANFKETQVEAMQPGEPVAIAVDAFPHHTFTGRIDSLSPASGAEFALLPPDNATGNFTKIVQRIPVKITFDPQSVRGFETRLAPGMSATVTVDISSRN